MSARQRIKDVLKPLLFLGTPWLGIPLLPLRLLDLVLPGNAVSCAVARAVNAIYPGWFRSSLKASSRLDDPREYIEYRRESARSNWRRFGVEGEGVRTLLELGCGTGAKTSVLAEEAGASIAVGCDPDPESLAFAVANGLTGRDRAPRLVRSMDYALPFRDGAFDMVACVEVLEHVPDPGRLLAEARRIMAPGARFVALIGPLYLHAKGPHLQHYLTVLWPQVLFSVPTIRRLIRSLPPRAGLRSPENVISVFETLNGLGYRAYARAIRASGFEVERLELVAEMPWAARLPVLGAFYRKSIRVVLRKPETTKVERARLPRPRLVRR